MNMIEAFQRAKDEGITIAPKIYPHRKIVFRSDAPKTKLIGFFQLGETIDVSVEGGRKPYSWNPISLMLSEIVFGDWIEVEPVNKDLID